MMVCVNKETRFNLRVTEEFREEIKALADYYGLTESGMAHSLLVRAVRVERDKIASETGTKPQGRRVFDIDVGNQKPTKKTKTG